MQYHIMLVKSFPFNQVYNPHHVLHRLLPQIKDSGYKLRQRANNLTLPSDVSLTARHNFIPTGCTDKKQSIRKN